MPVDDAKRRAYQERTTDESADALRAGKDVVIISSTGSGKTRMSLEAIKLLQWDAEDTPFRTLFVQDRLAVAEQNKAAADKLRMSSNALWTDGRNADKGRTVFASIDTALKPDSDLKGFSLLVIDEVHHAGATDDKKRTTEYSRLIETMTRANPGLRVLGMSATDERNDGRPLHPRLEGAHRIRVTYHEALEAGSIVPVRTIVPEWRLNARGSPTIREAIEPFFRNGDPAQRDDGIRTLLNRNRPADFLEYVVDQTRRHANGIPAFAYVSSTRDADRLAAAYRAEGIAAQAVHYKYPAAVNRSAMREFDAGRLDVLVSVDMLTEGVDSTRVGAVINAKETTTRSDMMQMVGRAQRAHTYTDGLRPVHKERAINLDLGATTYIHGTPETAMALEALGHHGRSATDARLWKTVAPDVLALNKIGRTVFAVRNSASSDPEKAWALFVRDDDGAKGVRTGPSTTIRRSPTPWASSAGMESYEREEARAMPRAYAIKESEQAGTGKFGWTGPGSGTNNTKLQEMAEASYKISKGSLDMMTKGTIGQDANRRPPSAIGDRARTASRRASTGIG